MPRRLTRLLGALLVAGALTGCGADFSIFPAVTTVSDPLWSPDGERIVFYLKGESGRPGERYVVEADGDGLRRLRDLEQGSADLLMARAVLEEARVERRAGLARLRRIGVRTTGRWPGGAHKELVHSVAWSPDRRWIAYSYRSPGRTSQDVYVIPADGSSKPRFVARHADSPSWSPDSRKLAFETGLKGIFVVPAAGGRPRRLPVEVDGVGLGDLAWSPDGTRIAFVTVYALHVAEITTGHVRRVADTRDA